MFEDVRSAMEPRQAKLSVLICQKEDGQINTVLIRGFCRQASPDLEGRETWLQVITLSLQTVASAPLHHPLRYALKYMQQGRCFCCAAPFHCRPFVNNSLSKAERMKYTPRCCFYGSPAFA
eukprot:720428-Pelagomonas_calceolata.AAC.4